MNKKELRERFYEKFLFKIHHPHTNEVGYADRICDHFLAEIKAERERVVRVVEGMKKKGGVMYDGMSLKSHGLADEHYNQACDDIIKILNQE